MFEHSFGKIAEFSSRNSGKVIIAWIVIFLLMAPAATLLFKETSYNIGSSIVPPTSMAQVASNYLSSEFGSSNTGSSVGNNSSSVLVTNNTNINSQSVTSSLIPMIKAENSYLKNITGYSNITSVFSVEKGILLSVSSGMKKELNSTYSLIETINNNAKTINTSLNETVFLEYGIPDYYLHLLKSYNNSLMAYNNTVTQIKIQHLPPFELNYFNNVTYFFNKTNNMTNSIHETLYNSSFPQFMLTNNTTKMILGFMFSINGNLTISNFNKTSSYDPYAYRFVTSSINSILSENTSLVKFVTTDLNISMGELVGDSFNLSNTLSLNPVLSLSVDFVYNGFQKTLYLNPEIQLNPSKSIVKCYISTLNGTSSINKTVDSEMTHNGFDQYPVIPTSPIYHQFVGYNNATLVIMITSGQNLNPSQTNQMEEIARNYTSKIPQANVYVAGTSTVDSQLASESLNGMIKALILGIILSVMIVGIFLRSIYAAFLPLAMFGISVVVALGINGLLYKYVIHGTVSFITPTLLLVLLLGLVSDYVVYIMSRFRRELRKGNPKAVEDSGQWAGNAVFTSGLTVALSYVVLYISHVPIFSDSGITNAIGVVVAILVANTLLIAILKRAGPKVFYPSKINHNAKIPLENTMDRVAGFVIKNKGKLVVVLVLAALFGSYVYFITPTNMDVFNLVPSSSGIQAIEVVNDSFHGDFFDRGYVIVKFQSPLLNSSGYNSTEIKEVTDLENQIRNTSGISEVFGPTMPFGYYIPFNLTGIPNSQKSIYLSKIDSFIGKNSSFAVIDFQLSNLAWTKASSDSVKTMIQSLSTKDSAQYSVYVGGETESLNNAYSFTASAFTKMVPILIIAIFVVLLIQLSSALTPLRLIFMVIASVVVALSISYGLIYYMEKLPILIFLPMFVFITLLAVGLDYDIFMVSRVREEVMKGISDQEAIKTSITENGGVIMALGTILFATFGSLYFSGLGIIQEIGIGLAFGVLVDTFISWPFFVPSIMLILKKLNWWPSKIGERKK
ncbi:MMPL family transporter [Oxyplasma meridianum]|uniref:MMPL family transporter n=1 Tax=Oxyplasma meridianum TaxID=3073602 RepID=A0AAX4NGJ5_9ARCH